MFRVCTVKCNVKEPRASYNYIQKITCSFPALLHISAVSENLIFCFKLKTTNRCVISNILMYYSILQILYTICIYNMELHAIVEPCPMRTLRCSRKLQFCELSRLFYGYECGSNGVSYTHEPQRHSSSIPQVYRKFMFKDEKAFYLYNL